ncbi:MAG: acetate--CoA ligase family protein, partial [Thermodesulfobacteriota bacterium]
PATREILAGSPAEAAKAAETIGFPVAIKGYGRDLMHKTEAGAVFLQIKDATGARTAYEAMEKKLGDRLEGVLVSEMAQGRRELVMGLHREPGFGPCVMIGIGGIMTEIINDTAFRVAPVNEAEAMDMAADLGAKEIFGPFRGEAEADMAAVCKCLAAIGKIGLDHPEISEIDVNPVIIRPDGRIVAVDALVILKGGE